MKRASIIFLFFTICVCFLCGGCTKENKEVPIETTLTTEAVTELEVTTSSVADSSEETSIPEHTIAETQSTIPTYSDATSASEHESVTVPTSKPTQPAPVETHSEPLGGFEEVEDGMGWG